MHLQIQVRAESHVVMCATEGRRWKLHFQLINGMQEYIFTCYKTAERCQETDNINGLIRIPRPLLQRLSMIIYFYVAHVSMIFHKLQYE